MNGERLAKKTISGMNGIAQASTYNHQAGVSTSVGSLGSMNGHQRNSDQGVRAVDPELPVYFQGIIHHQAHGLPVWKGYLVEGLAQDGIAWLFALLPMPPGAVLRIWWVGGLCIFAASLWISARDGSISTRTLLVIVLFSRLIDTLAMDIGKLDPFLMAFLVLSINRSPRLALIGAVLAGFCHPYAALLSAAGVFCINLAMARPARLAPVIATAASGVIDVPVFKLIFPGLTGRTGFILEFLQEILKSALYFGMLAFLAAFVIPLVSIIRAVGQPEFKNRLAAGAIVAWFLVSAILACVAAADHTRVAVLVTLAPAMTLIEAIRRGEDPDGPWRVGAPTLALLFAARLVIPHVDEDGPSCLYLTLIRSLHH